MRILDRILGRRLEATGELGYFGLTGWWLSSFSKAERDYMEAAFCSLRVAVRRETSDQRQRIGDLPHGGGAAHHAGGSSQ